MQSSPSKIIMVVIIGSGVIFAVVSFLLITGRNNTPSSESPSLAEPVEPPLEITPISDNLDVFYTEENELSRLVKYEVVDKYAADHPWLLTAWNMANRADFKYAFSATEDYASVVAIDPGGRLTMPRSWHNETFFFSALIHEIAHIYTLNPSGMNFSPRPGAIAAGHLYFNSLEGFDCPGRELYADMGARLVLGLGTFNFSQTGNQRDYRSNCGLKLPDEAWTVAESTFKGEMPQWFYDTFQTATGGWDYEQIWTMTKNAIDWDKEAMFVQWENEFGGYCSKSAAYSSLLREIELAQPWRDGGCDDDEEIL